MQSSNKSSQDLIQVHWRTICYEIRDQKMGSGLQDFAVLQLDQSPAEVQHATSVQFSAGTSKKGALESLQSIIEAIERRGLPETTRTVPREHAALITQAQEHADKLSDAMQKLPPDLRVWMQSVLQHFGEPGFDKYLNKVARKIGQDTTDEENGHD